MENGVNSLPQLFQQSPTQHHTRDKYQKIGSNDEREFQNRPNIENG